MKTYIVGSSGGHNITIEHKSQEEADKAFAKLYEK